jgi:hypothetical protein
MVTSGPQCEEIIYERSDAAPGQGPLLFVTVVLRDEARDRVTRESHVFLPRENRHLHELEFAPRRRADRAAVLAGCIRATHRLFADQLVRAGNERASGGEGLSYATRRLDAHPFHDFRLRRQFLDEMWEIQDWTISPGLRDALARVTRYRADSAEAELLGRIFAAG